MLSWLPQPASDRMTVDVELMLNSPEFYLPQDLLYEDIIRKPLVGESTWRSTSKSTAGSITPCDDLIFDSQTEESLSPHQFLSQNSSDVQTEEEHLRPGAIELPLPPNSWTQRSSWYIQPHEEQVQVPGEALKALQNLIGLVSEGHLRYEDIRVHEITTKLYPLIPSDHEGNVTSLGSILHAQSACAPCAFFHMDRCRKKDLCVYCHFEHDNDKIRNGHGRTSRKSKKKRMRDKARYQKLQLDQLEQCEATSKLILTL